MGKNNVKYTYEYVKDFIESNSKCKLITKEYINSKIKMEVSCECGNTFNVSFSDFKNIGKRQCTPCGKRNSTLINRLSIEYARELCEKNGYQLISEKYINNMQKLTVKSENGYLYTPNIENMKQGVFGQEFHKGNKYSIDNIKNYISITNLKCELLSEEYIKNNMPLKFRCECGEEFDTTLTGLTHGKTTCDKCSGFIQWNIEKVKEFVKENSDCVCLSDEYQNNETRIKLLCSCGNEFSTRFSQFQLRNIRQCKKCSKEDYTHPRKMKLEDVEKIYNDCDLLPLFKKYVGYNKAHPCLNKDGFEVYISIGNLLNGKTPSVFGKGNPSTIKNIIIYLERHEPEYVLIDTKFIDCKTKMDFKCDKGHDFKMNWSDFQMGRRCTHCRGDKISKAMLNTIENFKDFVASSTDGEYECVSNEYVNSNTHLKLIHNECGRIFEVTPAKFTGSKNRNGSRCPHCQMELLESVHATVLKQLFLKYKKDVILEDKSCINPLTGNILPTDIVCHSEKIVVEIQSWFHDREEQKIKDAIKKKYWEELGYKVYTPDVRKYSSLTMARIFFPKLKSIPEWVDFKYGIYQIDTNEVQRLLELGCSTKVIAEKLEVNRWNIQNVISKGCAILPDGHYNKMKNIKVVIQLDLNGNFIGKYDNASQAQKLTSISQPIISECLRKERKYNMAKGFIWISESDYISKNYEIPPKNFGRNKIIQLTKDGKFLNCFNGMMEAQKETGIHRDTIFRSCKGNLNCGKGFLWMYEYNYEEMLENQNKVS